MKRSILLIIAALVLAVSVFLFQSDGPESVGGDREFRIVIEQKKIVSGDSLLVVNEGASVRLIIRTDEPEEFHLHGYDRSVDLLPDTDNILNFTANLTGRFSFELEQSKTELGAVEVHPK